MEYITLGNSDLKVSKICLGCMGFGDATQGMHTWTLDYPSSKEIIKQALDSGINFFDTAMGYSAGTSEVYVGKALRELTSRGNYVVATKFIPKTQEALDNNISTLDFIESCLDASLERMGLDYVDLYIYHMWDYNTPIEEIMDALNALIQKGKIKEIGISNCYAYQLAQANEYAKYKGYKGFITIQGHYNLLFREEEREMAKYCRENNISMTPYSALASGRLARTANENTKRLEEDTFAKGKYDSTKEVDDLIVERVHGLSIKKCCSMTEISLAWLLTKVASPVVGATKPHHIEGAVKAVDLNLTQEEIDYLEELYVPHKIVGVMAK